jgi:hypothetical protein
MRYEFEAEIWRSDGAGGWFFVTLPADVAQGLRVLSGPKTGFGSIRVSASLNNANWNTSVFPDARSGGFILPVKVEVRRRANVTAGALVRIGVELTT